MKPPPGKSRSKNRRKFAQIKLICASTFGKSDFEKLIDFKRCAFKMTLAHL